MQLGSGTFDFPLELRFQNHSFGDLTLGLTANIRTGTNSRHYRLGNNYGINARYKIEHSAKLHSFIGLAYQYSDSIKGRDNDLIVNGPFPFPAGITNPQLYGGKKINFRVGLLMQLNR